MKQRPNKDLIVGYLLGMSQRIGRAPSRSEFVSVTGIAEHQVSRFFPTWNDALRAAGIDPYILNVRLEDRVLLEDWANAVRKLRKIPARQAYRHLGKFDHRTFERRFGPWSALPQVFRDFAQGKPEWADVVALLPVPAPKPSSKPEPIAAPNPIPIAIPLNDTAPDQPPPYSFRKNNVLPNKLRHAPLEDRPAYGNPLDFRGLRHEPVNEQGVVLLFGMVAAELGYIVEAVQSGFPDCEAKREIGPERWQRVHLEFEFESRNFRDHGHPVTGCDVIVCWRHNWPACPAHIEVLELSSLIQSLPASVD